MDTIDSPAHSPAQAGLTLVPYRAYNARGQLTWVSKWVRLLPGETVAQAAVRLSVVPPEP